MIALYSQFGQKQRVLLVNIHEYLNVCCAQVCYSLLYIIFIRMATILLQHKQRQKKLDSHRHAQVIDT